MADADDLKKVVDTKDRLVKFWKPRTEIIERDRKLRDLDEKASILGSQWSSKVVKVIDSLPQDYWDLAVATLSNDPVKFVVPPPTASKSRNQEPKHAMLERFAYGIDRHLNVRLQQRGEESWQTMLAEQMCFGWYACVPDVVKLDDGTCYFDITFWDPATVFQQFGPDGLEAVVHVYTDTLGHARSHAEGQGETLSADLRGEADKSVTVTDYWARDSEDKRKVLNALLVDDRLALPLSPQANWDEVPVITGAVAGRSGESAMPSRNKEQKQNWGRGILAPMRYLIPQLNHWRTLHRERARRAIFEHVFDITVDAQGIVERSDLEAGESTIMHLKPGEDVRTLPASNANVDINIEMQADNVAMERASLPASLYGVNRPNFASGFLEASLSHKATMRLGRRRLGMDAVSSRVMMVLIRRYRSLGGRMTLDGVDLRRNGMDGYFEEEFKASDIPETFFMQAKGTLAAPIDKAQIANTAMQLAREGVWSKRRAQEETGVEDPDSEDIRIVEEQAAGQILGVAAMMALTMRRKADALRAAGETEMALVVAQQADALLAQSAQQALQNAAGQNAPQQNGSTAGPPPGTLPNEATGQNTDLAGAGLGAAPPAGPSQARPGNRNASSNGSGSL